MPNGAKTHFDFHVPWDKTLPADDSVFDGPFNQGLFGSKSTNLGGAVGGPTGSGTFYTYRQLPSGTPTSYYIAGDYTFKVTARSPARP